MEIKRNQNEEPVKKIAGGAEQSIEDSIVRLESDPSGEIEPSVQQALSKLATFAREATDQPEYFWKRQQAAIRSRIAVEEAAKQSWRGLLWAGALGLLLIASLATINRSATPVANNAPDPDQELLMNVEQAVHSGVPAALEPAALLADEMDSALSVSSNQAKESRNAN